MPETDFEVRVRCDAVSSHHFKLGSPFSAGSDLVAGNHRVIVIGVFHLKEEQGKRAKDEKKKKEQSCGSSCICFPGRVQFIMAEAKTKQEQYE